MDNPQREITTSHVFNTKQQRQYPQTRRVVYTPARGRKKYSMSTSPYGMDQFDEELEMYDRRRLGSTGHSYSGKSSITPPPSWSNQIVQEVSLSYSAPLTISPTPHDVPLKIHVSQGNRMDDYGNINSAGSLQDYLSQYESKVSKHRPVQSLERVDNRGRFETEFPVRISYIGGETVSPPPTHLVPIVPIGFPVKSYDSRSHNHRSSSGLSDTIISETTTIEEMTTITTTNQRRSHQQMTPSPTNVNALAQQFEQTARREYIDAQRNRKAAQSPSGTRVVVITKPGPDYVYSSDEGFVHRVEKSAYSPADKKSVVTTTVVDIEPPGYRSRSPRYMEERYQVQEEYRSVKTYPSLERKRPEREHVIVSPTYGSRTEVIEENIRERVTYSRSSSPVMEPEQEQSRGSTPVRSVVEQFESRIEADNRKPKSTVMTSSLDEYSINRKEVQEKPKAVFIPRGESLSTREGSRDEITVERTTTPVPPRTVEAEPVSPVEEKYSPEKEKSPAKVQLKSRTDTNIRLNAYEEITTTTQKVGPKTEERKQEELKNEEMNSGSASGGTSSAMHSSSSYSSKTVSGGAQVSGSISTGGAHSGGAQMSEYSSTISSRPAFNRTVHSSSSTTAYGAGAHSGGRSLLITESASLSGLSPFGQNAASSIRDAREREKKEMSDLNDRLASYIEKVRFLEAQNRKLATDLEMLQGRWGSDTTSVRVMYESELKTAKVVIEESNRQRDALEVEIRRLMTELTEYRKKYEDAVTLREGSRNEADGLLARLGEIEAEINLVKRRIVYVEEEVARIKRENQRLMGELSRHRTVIEQESLNRIDFQNQVQTLLEECQYVGRVHTSELGDLVVMAHRDTTPENREFFKHELASAIRDIRAEYDQISNATRSDMESWYKLKVQEITTHSSRTNMEQTYAREEVKKLRVTLSEMRSKLADLEGRNVLLEKQIQELNYQLEDDQRSYEAALNDRDSNIRKMREECQALMVELQMLLDTKQTLDAEIAIYRKMLEGEENRAGLRQLVEQVVKTTSYSQDHAIESTRVLKSESSSRSNFQTSSKGNVSIHSGSARISTN